MDDVEKIRKIAANDIEIINKANEEPSKEERKKNAIHLRDIVYALKSIANETETMQKAAKINREINAVIKVYNAYAKRLRADATKKFIEDHVEILVKE